MASYERDRKADLLRQAKARGLAESDATEDDYSKTNLVELLERADREGSVSQRDQGQQAQQDQDRGADQSASQGGAQAQGTDRGVEPRAVRGSAQGPSPASRGQDGMMPADEAVATGEGATSQAEATGGETVEPIADVPGSREGPEAELAEPTVQPTQTPRPVASGGQWAGPPGSGDAQAAIAAKQNAVGGEGVLSPAEGLAAAEAGNQQVAELMQPELEAGWRGLNPAAHQNVEHTVAGHLAFQKLSKEEQDRRRRELHLANQANLRGDDWS